MITLRTYEAAYSSENSFLFNHVRQEKHDLGNIGKYKERADIYRNRDPDILHYLLNRTAGYCRGNVEADTVWRRKRSYCKVNNNDYGKMHRVDSIAVDSYRHYYRNQDQKSRDGLHETTDNPQEDIDYKQEDNF